MYIILYPIIFKGKRSWQHFWWDVWSVSPCHCHFMSHSSRLRDTGIWKFINWPICTHFFHKYMLRKLTLLLILSMEKYYLVYINMYICSQYSIDKYDILSIILQPIPYIYVQYITGIPKVCMYMFNLECVTYCSGITLLLKPAWQITWFLMEWHDL